jgi:hypothetical protein
MYCPAVADAALGFFPYQQGRVKQIVGSTLKDLPSSNG